MTSAQKRKQVIGYLAAFLTVIAADQLFKGWIVRHIPLGGGGDIPLLPGVIHLTYIRNAGAAFGLMQGGRWIFLILLAAFCALVVWALRTRQLTDGFSRWMAVLACGGAVANGVDRAVYGYVVDMFELEFVRFAVFNVADAVMNVCAVLFLLRLLLHREPPAQA